MECLQPAHGRLPRVTGISGRGRLQPGLYPGIEYRRAPRAGIGHHAVVESERVLGVDACRAGWIGIALTGQNCRAYVAGAISELVAKAETDGPLAVVAIDMPIGLPDREHRQADVLAKKVIGVLRSSVFLTP